jgi:thiol:disulfide interchange protein DsbA
MKRWIVRLAAPLLFGFALSAGAAGFPYTAGEGYTVLATPQPAAGNGKVAVTEFFWYNCPHCAEFEPTLEAWLRKKPSWVEFDRVPVAFSPAFLPQQKFYYALKALGKVDALQGAVFDAIHNKQIHLDSPDQMANWMQAHGVPKAQFMDAYNSFGVQMQAQRATQMMNDYEINGVPTLAVQGMYTLSASMPQTPTNEKVLEAVDAAVEQLHHGKTLP